MIHAHNDYNRNKSGTPAKPKRADLSGWEGIPPMSPYECFAHSLKVAAERETGQDIDERACLEIVRLTYPEFQRLKREDREQYLRFLRAIARRMTGSNTPIPLDSVPAFVQGFLDEDDGKR